MIFSPHTIQKKVITGATIEKGNPIKGSESWINVGKCRCDDNSQQKQISVNGVLIIYNYHVVHEGERIDVGTEVQCLDENGNIRGSGIVVKTGKCNYFSYSEIWM